MFASLLILVAFFEQSRGCFLGEGTVCGLDMVEYPNRCALAAAMVGLKNYGACSSFGFFSVCQGSPDLTPVCGTDGITYANDCFRIAANTNLAYTGPCFQTGGTPITFPTGATCPNCLNQPMLPVCINQGTTFVNGCFALCGGQTSFTPGICAKPCGCDLTVYDPVCSDAGITFDNKCAANCMHATGILTGECANFFTTCKTTCSDVLNQVCGSDGKTYKNLCALRCAKVRFNSFGQCPTNNACQSCPLNGKKPVCSTDGRTYPSDCFCKCDPKCKKYADGPCPNQKQSDLLCLRCSNYKHTRVCGRDRKTYDNMCYLLCNNDDLEYYGECGNTNNWGPTVNVAPAQFGQPQYAQPQAQFAQAQVVQAQQANVVYVQDQSGSAK